MFDLSNYSTKSTYHNDSNKLVIGKIKDETCSVAIREFAGLKPKMYSFLIEDNSEQKKAKGVNRNLLEILTHSEYKNVLLNNKCVSHSMNRIQSKDHRIVTYEISKISLSCFDDKKYIQGNGYNGLALGYQS